ncbi:MAG: hypothetical protein SV487_01595 [Thermodesulfobacteriota bacterium]|nr:hypothetical protein [Thermodesulfobacteriota bacterium]
MDYIMRLTPEISKSNRRLGALSGGLKGLIALVLVWVGINSFIIGWAYNFRKGAWMPLLAGAVLTVLGVWLLGRGVEQITANLSSKGPHKENGP